MTVPDAQPPVMWWSPSDPDRLSTYDDIEVMFLDLNVALPADAVRLVAEPTDCNAIMSAHALCDSAARGVVQAFDNAAWVSNGPVAAAINHLRAALAGTTTPADERTEIEYGVVWPDGSERVYGGDCTDRLCAEQHGKYAADADACAVCREVRTVYGPWQPLASTPTEETNR